MRFIYNGISFMSFGFCLFCGFKGLALITSLSFILCLAFLFYANLDKLKRFKASTSGFEGETREFFKKAEVTIKELQELAQVVAQTYLSLVMRSGRFGGFDAKEKENIKDKVLGLLSQLGVETKKQSEILNEWHNFMELDYVLLILGSHVPKFSDEEIKIWKELRSDLLTERPKPSEIKKFLRRNNALSEEHEEAIKDFEYYINNRKHRRPEVWENYREERKKLELK